VSREDVINPEHEALLADSVAARQFASRARRRVQRAAPHPDADLRRQREVVDAFLAAVRGGDFDGLLAVLDPDVILRSDRGSGAPREIRGARAVAEPALFYSRLAQAVRPVLVNGAAGIVSRLPGGQPSSVMGFTVRHGTIAEIEVFGDPERLRTLDLTALNE
jgi:RNA polymerase sigma-70 factor (ECF subfamily)